METMKSGLGNGTLTEFSQPVSVPFYFAPRTVNFLDAALNNQQNRRMWLTVTCQKARLPLTGTQNDSAHYYN